MRTAEEVAFEICPIIWECVKDDSLSSGRFSTHIQLATPRLRHQNLFRDHHTDSEISTHVQRLAHTFRDQHTFSKINTHRFRDQNKY